MAKTSRWPKDNQAALIAFYGDPGSKKFGENLVKFVPPFKMYYEGKPVKSLSVHRLALSGFVGAFQKIWDYYGHDQAEIDRLEISKYSGTYNPRKVRGSATKWSNHAYGAAIDIDAEDNGLGAGKGDIPLPVVAAFKSEGARWGGEYTGRTDPMHFEFCDGGQPQKTFEEWLAFYKCRPFKKPKPLGLIGAIDFDDDEQYLAPTAPASEPALPIDGDVKGDPYIWLTQQRLKEMKYSPGGLDGIWGGLTGGAISGFINDRGLDIVAPTSEQMFRDILEPLKVALSKAETENFTRPIAPERAEATAAQLAPTLPEVKAAASAERMGFWASIAGAVTSAVAGVAKMLGDAVEMLNPVKAFIGDMPWQVWLVGALVVSGGLYFISRRSGDAKNAATQAYQEGSRT